MKQTKGNVCFFFYYPNWLIFGCFPQQPQSDHLNSSQHPPKKWTCTLHSLICHLSKVRLMELSYHKDYYKLNAVSLDVWGNLMHFIKYEVGKHKKKIYGTNLNSIFPHLLCMLWHNPWCLSSHKYCWREEVMVPTFLKKLDSMLSIILGIIQNAVVISK